MLGVCPRIKSGTPHCEMVKAERTLDHEAMDHHDMDERVSVESRTSDSDESGPAVEQPEQPCSHCALHSRSTPNVLLRTATETIKRVGDINVPHAVSVVPVVNLSFEAIPTSRAHGPPGQDSRPTYILLNTFRI